jgi:hypothetical protein
MGKHVWLAACLLLWAACGLAAEAPMSVRAGECSFTLTFPGTPNFDTTKTKLLPPSVTRAVNLVVEFTRRESFTASRGCSDTERFGDIAAAAARQALEDSTDKIGAILLDAQFRNAPELGKMLARKGEIVSRLGKFKVRGRPYYTGSCTLQLAAGGPVEPLAATPPLSPPRPPQPSVDPPPLTPQPPSTAPAGAAEILKQMGAALAARFASTLKANATANRALRPADFASSMELIQLMSSADQGNGHALYYAGEIARKTGAPGKGHAQFEAYLETEATLGPAARAGSMGVDACHTPRGYCRQRTAWIDFLLAADLYQEARARKTATPIKPTIAGDAVVDLQKALGYACDALKLYGYDVLSVAPTTKLVSDISAELGGRKCP